MNTFKKYYPKGAYSFKAARAFYFTALIAYTISIALNQIDYYKHHLTDLIITDSISIGLIYFFLLLYIWNKINFRINSAVYVYILLINLIISTWYFYEHNIDFVNNFLLTTFFYSINIVVAGICIGRSHVYIASGLFILSLGLLIFVSGNLFLIKNAAILLFLILAFSFAVFVFLFLLDSSYKKEQTLKEEIHKKDKAFAQEQNK